MTLPRLLLHFFMIFFTLQLFLGEAGIIAFIQKKHSTSGYVENITELIEINKYLKNQVNLNKENKSYLMMNAHRVGLLGEDEYLIKLDKPILFNSIVYSPGKIILEKKMFYISNMVLFIISLIFCSIMVGLKFMQNHIFREQELGLTDNRKLGRRVDAKVTIQKPVQQTVASAKNMLMKKNYNVDYAKKDINQKDNSEQWNYTQRRQTSYARNSLHLQKEKIL